MWKMTRLYLKNFAHIYSGLMKTEVELKLEDDNIINLMIGKMGSGKSAILGHIQPFASYGTLDIRNQDKQILPEKDGIKIIEYSHGDDHYVITHKYNWNKHSESHNIKSYIEYNGTELNPNGNSGSFKDIIKDHFGIDQSFLRLLRLGPNVTNVIELKSTERKNYMSTLVKDANIYNMLYKKLSEDMRDMNSKISVLSNKLMSLSSDKLSDMENELEGLQEDIKSTDRTINNLKSQISSLTGQNQILMSNKSYDKYTDNMKLLQKEIDELNKDIRILEDNLNKTEEISIGDISKEIGSNELRKRQLDERILHLNNNIEENKSQFNKLRDMRAISNSEEHMSMLRNQLSNLQTKYDNYNDRLKDFKCNYSYRNLAKFIDDMSILNSAIDEMSSYNKDDIFKVYKSDSSIQTYATHKIDMLTGRKVNIQKAINNMRYSEDYTPQMNMFRLPFCPSKTCPYFQTHPYIIKKGMNKEESSIQKALYEIEKLDIEISRYENYPTMYRKMISLKNLWKDSSNILNELGVLKESKLINILTNLSIRMNWYNHSKLIDILELCKMREEFYDLSENLNKTKSELSVLENSEEMRIESRIASNRELYNKLYDELVSNSEERENIRKTLDSLEQSYTLAQNRDAYKNQLLEKSKIIEDKNIKISEYENNLKIIEDNIKLISQNKYELNNVSIKYAELLSRKERLSSIINDIKYTQEEFDNSNEDRELLRDIMSATSSKDGIPLILIKIFLQNCKEIVNELISDVFPDDLEILDFNITENEFKIPYMTNGMIVDDIESASQGQRAIISIALSFALIRQVNQNTDAYNIMLLDEMDGPLYKKDRDKFISILFKQLSAIDAKQVFVISHNNTFEGSPVNIIMTTDEIVDKTRSQNIYRLY